jgi:DNA-binding NarL/FixJ family response regulator
MNESAAAPISPLLLHANDAAFGLPRSGRRARTAGVRVAIHVDRPGVGCVGATSPARAVSSAAVLLLSADGPDRRVMPALRAGAAGVLRRDSAPSDLALALARVGRGRSLRPRRRLRRRCPSEKAMQSPNVVELRRGSAHGPSAVPVSAAASNPRQIGGHRWNSAS